MEKTVMSRRTMLEAGICAMAAAASAPQIASAETGKSVNHEKIVRQYYAAWEKTDWRPLDSLLTDNFTFSSAAGDDHISKSVFKKQCWDTQNGHIDHFDLQKIFGNGDEAFVLYVCTTKNGKKFRNVEFLRLRGDKVEAVECYFGAMAGYPTVASKTQS